MLVHFGGRVRSRGEYDALLTGAGYRIERVTEVADAFAPFSVIEAVTAGR
jgi:hypothetical protein